jgi:hypothetical protein
MFAHIAPDEIPQNAEWLLDILAPAVRHDKHASLQRVYDDLCAGVSRCFTVTLPNARGVFVFRVFEEDGRIICWSSYIAGTVDGGPMQWVRTMRLIMAGFEQLLKSAEVAENRIGGRFWGRIFPDYEMHDPETNEMRKEL